MKSKLLYSLVSLSVLVSLSGCIVVSVASTAVSVTTTVVGGAIDVVDAVTPDIFDDDDKKENKKEDQDKPKN